MENALFFAVKNIFKILPKKVLTKRVRCAIIYHCQQGQNPPTLPDDGMRL